MPDFNHKYDDSKKPNHNFGELLLLLYITLNGFSVGGIIRTGRGIATNGTNNDSIIALLMYLGCTIYTAQRAYQLYKKIYKNDGKNRQR